MLKRNKEKIKEIFLRNGLRKSKYVTHFQKKLVKINIVNIFLA